MTTYDAYAPRAKTKPDVIAEVMNDRAVIGNNEPPEPTPEEAAFKAMRDLYDEAKNWADGTDIDTPEMLEAVQYLDKQIAECGKSIEVLRKTEKDPLDKLVKSVQDKFNPFTQKDKGLHDKARKALKEVASKYARKLAAEQEERARKLREAAAKAAEEAAAAMQDSAGDLDAREDAEEIAKEAKQLEREAARAEKSAGKGLGLRMTTTVTISEEFDAVEWAFGQERKLFLDLALTVATEYSKRMNVLTIPGFKITKEKQ